MASEPKRVATDLDENDDDHCRHVVADFWGCQLPATELEWRSLIRKAVAAMHATLLRVDVHLFEPQGGTAIAMLSESHLAIHTWPERDYVAVDIFTCGRAVNTSAGIDSVRAILRPSHEKVLWIRRGETARAYSIDASIAMPSGTEDRSDRLTTSTTGNTVAATTSHLTSTARNGSRDVREGEL